MFSVVIVRGKLMSDRDVYEELMDTYDSIARSYSSFRVRAWDVIKELSVCSGWVADVGCGPCHNGLTYASTSRSKLLCIDISQNMLKVAKTLASKSGDPNLLFRTDVLQADMRYLPVRGEALDRVMYIASVNHIHRKHLDGVLSECFRVLRRGGEGLITIWAAWHPTVLKGLLRNLIDLLIMRRGLSALWDVKVPWRSRGRTYLRYYHIYRLSEIVNRLRLVGFKVIKYGSYNPHRRLLPENYYVVLSK